MLYRVFQWTRSCLICSHIVLRVKNLQGSYIKSLLAWNDGQRQSLGNPILFVDSKPFTVFTWCLFRCKPSLSMRRLALRPSWTCILELCSASLRTFSSRRHPLWDSPTIIPVRAYLDSRLDSLCCLRFVFVSSCQVIDSNAQTNPIVLSHNCVCQKKVGRSFFYAP